MKIFTGKVISTKMAKTATVEVERTIAHPIYKKRMKRTRLFHVHDENSVAKVGEIIRFAASKPYSKLKRWAIVTGKAEKVVATKEVKAVSAKPTVKKEKPAAKKTVKKGSKK